MADPLQSAKKETQSSDASKADETVTERTEAEFSAPSGGDGEDAPENESEHFSVFPKQSLTSSGASGRGVQNPRSFRISAHHGMRPGNTQHDGGQARELESGTGGGQTGGDERESSDAENASNFSIPRGVTGRGQPTFRISAHHGMRPGNAANKDLASETADPEE